MSITRDVPIEPRNANRAAAAHEDSALSLGQGKIRRRFGDPHVRRGRELESAADHRAFEHRDDRDAAELEGLERAVPALRAGDPVGGVPRGDPAEVEPR